MNVLFALRRARDYHGARVAVYDGERTFTYAQFYDRAVRAGNALRQLGIKRGDRVAVLMLNSLEYLELYYATALIGAVIVPINTRWNRNDIAFTLSDSESSVLALDDRFIGLRNELDAQCCYLYTGRGNCSESMANYALLVETASAEELPGNEPDEEDLVGLFYTSGTTGGPKGVMLTHRNVWTHALYLNLEIPLGPNSVWFHAAPMFHLADQWSVYCVTLMGGSHVFLPTFDAEGFLRLVERHRVTDTVLIPTMINMLVNHAALHRCDRSSLRTILYGGSPMPLDLLRRATKSFPCVFRQVYGMTEASPLITAQPSDHDTSDDKLASSAGRPVGASRFASSTSTTSRFLPAHPAK